MSGAVGGAGVASYSERADWGLVTLVSDDGNAVAAELAARLSVSLSPCGRYDTVDETFLRVAHHIIPFIASLSFLSWRIVSRGTRLLESSRLMPIANRTPAITAAAIAEVK